MPVDSMVAARFYRTTRSRSQRTAVWQPHIAHDVMRNETLDPSLSHRLVYGNRADWYASAAINGMVEVDLPVAAGVRRCPLPEEISRIAAGRRKTGMSLYE